MAVTTAVAHPNVALVKYWGKQDKAGNLPATPNLSITLSTLSTQTSVRESAHDQLVLNGHEQQDLKVAAWLRQLRESYDIPPLHIETNNNFPTGAGLASSASGFAALITAINEHCALGHNPALCSDLARRGSASAARSIYGGFVALVPPQWQAQKLAPAEHWPLRVVVAVTSHLPKAVGSTEGMQRSRDTSAYYPAWVSGSGQDFEAAASAIEARNFQRLAEISELNCLKMHSLMLTSVPTLSYWTPATLACMETVRELRRQGEGVFFSIDAGPQVKAICLPESQLQVAEQLRETPGVVEVISCELGEGARIVPS